MEHSHPRVAENHEAAEVDRISIEEYGVASVALMETAGSKTADWLINHTNSDDLIGIVCGKGNNGGDALVCARQIHASGRKVGVHMVMGDNNLSPDAQANYDILQTISRESGNITFYENLQELIQATPDWWVDGIFGTGLSSEVREPVATAIKKINQHPSPVLALDVPSGLDGTKGNVLGTTIFAHTTLMYGMGKLGAYINAGPDYCGHREIIPLGFTGPALDKVSRGLIESDPVLKEAKVGSRFSHKYEAGIVYLFAGSGGMTGAAVMAAKAAWSVGAGGVVIFCPAGLLQVYEQLVPEAVKIPLGSANDSRFKPAHLEQALEKVKTRHPHVVLAGPGAGDHHETLDFFAQLLEKFSGKLIFDADAFSVFGKSNSNRADSQQLIVTPHRGEFARAKSPDARDDYSLLIEGENFASQNNLTLLLKGEPTLVTDSKKTLITAYPTHYYSRFGFGDVLAGMIAANFLHKNEMNACVSAMVTGNMRLQKIISKKTGHPAQPSDLIL